MDIKKAFSFKGRISRMNYFWYQLFIGIPIALLQILYNVFLTDKILLGLILPFFLIPLSIILMCKTIQRLHDINLPGILILIPLSIGFLDGISPTYNFVPLILVFQIFVLFKKGTKDYNKYGEAPLE